MEHRIGGLEKSDNSGHVSYDEENHSHMVKLRQRKVDIISNSLDEISPYGDNSGDLVVVGWGGTYGAIRSAVNKSWEEGMSVSHIHIRNLNPFPNDLGEKLSKFTNVLVPEINLGQLNTILRSKYLIDTKSLNKVEGKPFKPSEIFESIKKTLRES